MASTSSHRGTSLCVLVGPAFAKSKKKGCGGGWVCLSTHTFSQSLAGTKSRDGLGFDSDFHSSLRIASVSGLALTGFERSKAGNGDFSIRP